MKNPSILVLKKYLASLQRIKRKYVTSERLSKEVGVYPEVINNTLSFFDPMVNMDYEYNILELVPKIKEYIVSIEEEKNKAKEKQPANHIVRTNKLDTDKYKGVIDFIYQRMSIGGMIDKTATLSDLDLRILKKLVTEEQKNRKKTK